LNWIVENNVLDYIATLFIGISLMILISSKIYRDRIRARLAPGESKGVYGDSFVRDLWIQFYTLVGQATFVVPGNGKDLEYTRQRLSYAGYREAQATTFYYAIRIATLFIFPIIGLAILSNTELPGIKVFMYTLTLGGVGHILPSHVLDKLVERQQLRLKNAMPDALDLMVVCAEAGLGLNQALGRVGREIKEVHPELSVELCHVTAEMLGGLDREKALNNMYTRTGLEAIKSLVMVINQAIKLGTSIADTLRQYSDEYRQTRMQLAEENAAKMSTKMIFPLVLFFMPCFFIVTIGPAMIKMMKAF
jgi:tight adherence protein C